jgi:cytochrome c553
MTLPGTAYKFRRPPVLGLAAVLLGTMPATAQPMSYAERLQACHTCHGEDGNSKMEKIPSLAGQPAFYILNQLFLMREGVRVVEAMTPFVKDLKDEELDRLSKLFAALPAKPSGEAIDQAKAKRGEEISTQRRCSSCHLPSLAGQDQMPRLAKQRIDYLIPTLQSYRGTPRPGADTAMSAAIAGASDADIEALAHYCASK